MSLLIYIDTNVYIDLFEKRTDRLRPLDEFAFQLFRRVFDCEFNIVISSLVVEELEHNLHAEDIAKLKENLAENKKCVFVVETDSDEKEAAMLAAARKTSFNDTKHAVLAWRAGAKYLVTRNVEDFSRLHDIVKIALPESI